MLVRRQEVSRHLARTQTARPLSPGAPSRPVCAVTEAPHANRDGSALGHGAWPIAVLEASLGAIVPGCRVELVDVIDSTNSELMRRARSGNVSPTLLVAQHQSAGRGRMGRSWHSQGAPSVGTSSQSAPPLASLTFSFGIALAPHDWSGLSLAVGLAVASSLHPDLGLKWPNDIWFNGRKLAGILIETAGAAECRFTVIGVGINVAPRDPTGLSTPPACLQELLPEVDAAGALVRVAAPLVQAIKLFEQQGFAPLRGAFERRDVLRGQPVSLSDGRIGNALGVDENGALLVHTSDGMLHVTSAEVSVRPTGARAGGPR